MTAELGKIDDVKLVTTTFNDVRKVTAEACTPVGKCHGDALQKSLTVSSPRG